MNRKTTLFIFIIFFLLISLSFAETEKSKDIIKKTRNMANNARSLKSKGKIDEAVDTYLKISIIYKKLILENPENKKYKKNYLHYLNQTGQIQLRYAKDMAKKKKFNIASKYYNRAIQSFKDALLKIPKNKTFIQNIEYCAYYGGIAGFKYMLNTNGSAPDFTINAIDGSKIELKNYIGKPLILKFMTGWCPECKKNMLIMKQLYNKYNKKGFQIIVLSLDKLKNWKKRSSDKKTEEIAKALPFKIGWATKDIYYKYGVFRSVPTLFLLDKNLKIVSKVKSEDRSLEKLSAEIEKLL